MLSAHFGTVPGDTQANQRVKGDLFNLKPSVGTQKKGRRGTERALGVMPGSVLEPRGRELVLPVMSVDSTLSKSSQMVHQDFGVRIRALWPGIFPWDLGKV